MTHLGPPTLERIELEHIAHARLPEALRAVVAGDGSALRGLAWAPDGARPRPCDVDRVPAAEAIAAANRGLEHPGAESALALADPHTVAVVTGQQPGLFGGPLLTLLKALAAAKWAARLRAEGRPAVALFWIASQDHDALEVQTVGLPEALLRPPGGAVDLRPVGARPVGPWATQALAALVGAVPEPDAAFAEHLASLHAPDVPHGRAFAKTLLALLGPEAPLFVDPLQTDLGRLAAPALARLLREAAPIDRHLREAAPALHPGGEALVFRHDARGDRRRLQLREEAFVPRGDTRALVLDELLEELDRDPGAFSPTALGRPLVQEALLGPTLHVAGPSELAYWLPIAPLFARAPVVTLRPRAALLGARDRASLEVFGLDPAALLRQGEAAFHRAAAGPAYAALHADLEALVQRYEGAFALEPAWLRTRGSVQHNLGRFAARLRRARRRREPEAYRAAESARARLLPRGRLQDTSLGTAWLRLHLGAAMVPALREGLDLEPRWLQVFSL